MKAITISIRMGSTPLRSRSSTKDMVRGALEISYAAFDNDSLMGPIIRISPQELHVSDPSFAETLYRQDGTWDKYAWSVNAFSAPDSTIFTVDHHVHKIRRQPLAPFFSKARVRNNLYRIEKHLDRLCARISGYVSSGEIFDMGAATTAFSRDISGDFVIGKDYNSLSEEDFGIDLMIAIQGAGQIWRTNKFLRFLIHLPGLMPMDLPMKFLKGAAKAFFEFKLVRDHLDSLIVIDTDNILTLQRNAHQTKILMNSEEPTVSDEKATIVGEIMKSKRPAVDKTFVAILEEVITIGGAGFETTAGVLKVVLFHLFDKPEILNRLRAELSSISRTIDTVEARLTALEQLPYLTAILMEGLRLSPALATRLARVTPDRDLFYNDIRIPSGTAVGMTAILLHTDDTMYPEPRSFNPDRWMDPNPWSLNDKVFIPFSKGTRNCLGM